MSREFIKGYGPPCPHCGHIKSRRLASGWSEPDDHYLRYKRCEGCDERFTTVEVSVKGSTFYRLDYHARELRRERWRRRYAKSSKRMVPEKSDQLKVKVEVKKSSDFNKTHCFRGHKLTPDNLYIRPPSTHRRCRTCRDLAQRSYYLRTKRLAA